MLQSGRSGLWRTDISNPIWFSLWSINMDWMSLLLYVGTTNQSSTVWTSNSDWGEKHVVFDQLMKSIRSSICFSCHLFGASLFFFLSLPLHRHASLSLTLLILSLLLPQHRFLTSSIVLYLWVKGSNKLLLFPVSLNSLITSSEDLMKSQTAGKWCADTHTKSPGKSCVFWPASSSCRLSHCVTNLQLCFSRS